MVTAGRTLAGRHLPDVVRRHGAPVAEAAVAAGALVVAGLPWRQAYHLPGFVAALVVAGVAPVALAFTMAGWARLRPVVSYGGSLLGLLVLLAVVLGVHPTAVVHGLSRGPSRLLTDTLPLTGPRWVLVVPVVLTWLAAAVTGELLVRGRSPGPALAVMVAAFVVAFGGSSGAPGSSLGIGAALVALLALVALIRQSPWRAGANRAPSSRNDGRPPGRRLGAGALAAVVVAVVLWAVVPSLPGLGAGTTAVSRHAPVTGDQATSPLDTVAQLRDANPTQPAIPLVQVITSGPSTGYLALATFDTYDGGGWTFDRTYLPTGGRVPDPPVGQPVVAGPMLRQTYTITGAFPAELPFVPFVDHPVTVSGIAVDADATSGTVVPVSEPAVGERYTVVSQAPLVTLSGLSRNAQIAGAGGAAGIALPAAVSNDLGPTVTYLASLTHQSPAPTVAFLQALATSLQQNDKRLIPVQTQSGGTSLAEVASAVTVSHAATPEQFATLFATVARSLGVPARVVTGFRVVAPGGGLLPAGRTTVTNRQGWTWAEIPVVGMGWVVVDPTPAATTEVPTPPAPAQASGTTTTTTPAANALPTSRGGGHALAPTVKIPTHSHHTLSPWWIVAWVIAGVAVAIGVLFASVALRRALRRGRRRRAPPPLRAIGAWMDVLDTLSRAGADPGSASTTREVADLTGRSFGPDLVEPVRQVGAVADRALFSTGGSPDVAGTSAAWSTAVDFGRNLRGRLPRTQRLQGALRVGTSPARRRGRDR